MDWSGGNFAVVIDRLRLEYGAVQAANPVSP
jgi:hypothetical protein